MKIYNNNREYEYNYKQITVIFNMDKIEDHGLLGILHERFEASKTKKSFNGYIKELIKQSII